MKILRPLLVMAACVSLSVPAFAETWRPIGKGLYRESFMHAFYIISEYPELEVDLEESEQTPGRYRMVNPYAAYPDFIGSPGCYPGDYYVVVDASDPVHCFVETSKAGYQCGGNEMLIVGSMADDYYNNRYGDWILADKENICGKLVDGSITFPPNSLLASAWNQDLPWSDDIVWKICNDNPMFRLKLPGAPDLDINIGFNGINDAHTELTFNVTLGSSIEKARIALVEGDSSAGVAEKIADGTIPSVEITAGGDVVFPYTGDGIFTLAVVPYWEGTPRTASFKVFDIQYDETEWRKAGRAFYRDGIISGVNELRPYGFVYPAYEYYVEVEENVATPGYLRLVDPYGEVSPLSNGFKYDDSHKWYLYINASDPDKVVVEHAEGGVGLNLGYGVMEIWSYADRARNDSRFYAYGISDEEITAKKWFGKFMNNEITFPANSLCMWFPNVNPEPTAWYQANSKGDFLLKFEPGMINGTQSSDVESIEAVDCSAPAAYYRLDGTKVAGEKPVPGIYIVRKGDKAYKEIVR